MSANVQAVPHVRDPYGYFVAHNRRLLRVMAARPMVAQIVRAVLEGIDQYAAERGIDPARVDFDARRLRSGRIGIALCLDTETVPDRQWETRMSVGQETNGQKIAAVGGTVIVRVWDPEQETEGGIVLPDTAQEAPQVGEVLSVGELVRVSLKAGDTVVFPRFAGSEVQVGKESYLVLNESDVVARLIGGGA